MNWHKSILEDLDDLLDDATIYDHLRNQRITILGGSGFIGKWLLSSMIHANDVLRTNIDITVISKDSTKLRGAYGDKYQSFHTLDLDFVTAPNQMYLPESDYFVHAATSTNPNLHSALDGSIIVAAQKSSQAIINSGIKYGNVPRVIHLSSGAVYERQADLFLGLPEVEVLYHENLAPSYRAAKLLIENLISNAHRNGIIQAANPRLFAFTGPGLPIEAHFAVGNFIRDSLFGESITIKGNPRTRRSYMYPTDLVAWLLTILGSPTNSPINVGNSSSVSLEELASTISKLSNANRIDMSSSSSPPDSYFPSTLNTQKLYKVKIKVDLEAGLRKWLKYLVN